MWRTHPSRGRPQVGLADGVREEAAPKPGTRKGGTKLGTSAGAPTDQRLQLLTVIGSSGWTRTSNPPVNSRMLCH
jgi:hypothetical protein